MKVGDLVRRVGAEDILLAVPLKCFGIVVTRGLQGASTRVDFGHYGIFWMLPDEIELLS